MPLPVPVREPGQRWLIFDPDDLATVVVEVMGTKGEKFSGITHLEIVQVISQRGSFYRLGKRLDLGFGREAQDWTYELLTGQEKPL